MKAVALFIVVRAISINLTHIGIYPHQAVFDPGPVDGLYDQKTADAVKRFRAADPTLPEGERLVSVQNVDVREGKPDRRSLHDFVAWRAELGSVRELSASTAYTPRAVRRGCDCQRPENSMDRFSDGPGR